MQYACNKLLFVVQLSHLLLLHSSCDYLARKFCSADDDALAKHAICLCDDDNDLEMALACHHAFAPGVSSDSMARVISDNPRQITATGGPGQALEGTRATEKALQLALDTVSTQ